jgi:hypothetical protein
MNLSYDSLYNTLTTDEERDVLNRFWYEFTVWRYQPYRDSLHDEPVLSVGELLPFGDDTLSFTEIERDFHRVFFLGLKMEKYDMLEHKYLLLIEFCSIFPCYSKQVHHSVVIHCIYTYCRFVFGIQRRDKRYLQMLWKEERETLVNMLGCPMDIECLRSGKEMKLMLNLIYHALEVYTI